MFRREKTRLTENSQSEVRFFELTEDDSPFRETVASAGAVIGLFVVRARGGTAPQQLAGKLLRDRPSRVKKLHQSDNDARKREQPRA
jgi:hypothetical protein